MGEDGWVGGWGGDVLSESTCGRAREWERAAMPRVHMSSTPTPPPTHTRTLPAGLKKMLKVTPRLADEGADCKVNCVVGEMM